MNKMHYSSETNETTENNVALTNFTSNFIADLYRKTMNNLTNTVLCPNNSVYISSTDLDSQKISADCVSIGNEQGTSDTEILFEEYPDYNRREVSDSVTNRILTDILTKVITSTTKAFTSEDTVRTVASVTSDGEHTFEDTLSMNLTNSVNDVRNEPEYNWIFLLLGIFIFVGVVGNILVCLAICLERRLQNATNYFLLSLAVADLLVSVIVMPILILDDFYGYWPFSPTLCNIWVTCDVLCSSSSIIHLCFISVGRYIGIRNPLHARQAPLLVSRRAVMLKIALVWFISALVTSPLTIVGLIDRSNVQPTEDTCRISNRYFEIFGSIIVFFLPMIVMVNTYVLTVRLLSRKAKFCRHEAEATLQQMPSTSSTENQITVETDRMYLDTKSANKLSGKDSFQRRSSNSSNSSAFSGTSGSVRLMVNKNTVNSDRLSPNQRYATYVEQCNSVSIVCCRKREMSNCTLHRWNSSEKRVSSKSQTKKHKSNSRTRNTQPLMLRTLGSSLQVRTEQKATKVLGLVFFVFLICWTPFFILNVISGTSPDIEIPEWLVSLFQWLGFISSTINPIIYTIFNRNFRRAFRRILLCQMFGHSPQNHTIRRKASNYDLTHSSHQRSYSSYIRSQPQNLSSGTTLDKQISRQSVFDKTNANANSIRNGSDNGCTQQFPTINATKTTLSWKFKPPRDSGYSCDADCSEL